MIGNIKNYLKSMFFTKKEQEPRQLTPEHRDLLQAAQGQAFFAKTVLCIIYAMIGDVKTEISRRKVNLTKRYFEYKEGTYLLITTKDKVKIVKAPWYSLAVQYIAQLDFIEGDAVPLSHSKSDLKEDAHALNRVMSKASRDTLLPKSDSMLMFMLMLAIVGMLIMMGLVGYLLTDPQGAENIKTFTTPGGAD